MRSTQVMDANVLDVNVLIARLDLINGLQRDMAFWAAPFATVVLQAHP